jgi:4-amino-4-deoxy-L-arabinose transferase-like glycosyltransferase
MPDDDTKDSASSGSDVKTTGEDKADAPSVESGDKASDAAPPAPVDAAPPAPVDDAAPAPVDAAAPATGPVTPYAASVVAGPPSDEDDEDEQAAPVVRESTSGWRRWAPLSFAALVAVVFFFLLPPLTKSGLWDPYELNIADLARRVALNLHGAANLALDGSDNSLPHLNDLGRPQLPFTSIAIGFKLFGLHEWAGRAPLAIWGVLGVLATYAFVARLFDRRAGAYAAVALATMPVYFVQARSMLGEIVTMSAVAMAFGGLVVAVFDRDEKGPTGVSSRLPWLLMGLVGLAAGWGSRGGVLGVAAPLVGVGLAWAMSWASGERKLEPFSDLVGALSLAGGLAVGVLAFGQLDAEGSHKDLSLLVGAMIHPPSKYPTWDLFVGSIGHAMAPWSAFLPFALGRLFLSPVGRDGELHARESRGRMAVLVGLTVVFAAHAMLASKTDLIAFTGPALAAAACAIAIRDFERGAPASIAIGVGTVILLAVFHHDFHELPEKAYQAFGVTGATFPDSFKTTALNLWWAGLGGFALVAFLTWVERDSKRDPFDPARYSDLLKVLRDAYDGMLALIYFALVAGASLAGLFIWVGVRTHARWLPTMSLQVRDGILNAWWVLALLPLGVVFGVVFACDVWLWAFNRSRPLSKASVTRGFEPFEAFIGRCKDGLGGRDAVDLAALAIVGLFMFLVIPLATLGALSVFGVKLVVALPVAVSSGFIVFFGMGIVGDVVRHRAASFALGGLVVGGILCGAYYPALANQLSPKEVFESYRVVHKECEPLALLGVGGRTAAYYAGGEPRSFTDVTTAFHWMREATPGCRRFLAMKSEELPKLNELYRETQEPPRQNVPVIDARSSQILLVASSLLPNETNENPLDKMILSAEPHPQRKLDVNMEDKLEVLGIDIIDLNGKPVDSVAPGRKYNMRTYYRVLAPITTEWEAFIHIDGYHRRHNGDHKPLNSKYPMSLWLKDDLIVDEYDVSLEPNFTPGAYTIYFGLFVGDTRLKVKSGPSDGDNRINGGQLRVQ